LSIEAKGHVYATLVSCMPSGLAAPLQTRSLLRVRDFLLDRNQQFDQDVNSLRSLRLIMIEKDLMLRFGPPLRCDAPIRMVGCRTAYPASLLRDVPPALRSHNGTTFRRNISPDSEWRSALLVTCFDMIRQRERLVCQIRHELDSSFYTLATTIRALSITHTEGLQELFQVSNS
jgi:hypothetical protein